MSKIYVWPNDDWCKEEDYEIEHVTYMSDDYRVVEVSDDWDYDQIDDFVCKLNRNKL